MGASRWRRALLWLQPLLVLSLVLAGLPDVVPVAARASLATTPGADQQPGSSGAVDVATAAAAAAAAPGHQDAANLKQAGTAEDEPAETSASADLRECKEAKGDPPHSRAVHALPSGDGDATPIELGKSVQLDKLGPIIVNSDGTTRRIRNWANMTKLEQAWALKRINERNKQRVENLNQQANNGRSAEDSAPASHHASDSD